LNSGSAGDSGLDASNNRFLDLCSVLGWGIRGLDVTETAALSGAGVDPLALLEGSSVGFESIASGLADFVFASETLLGAGDTDTDAGSGVACEDSVTAASAGGLVSAGVSFSSEGGSGAGGLTTSVSSDVAEALFASGSGVDCGTVVGASCMGSVGFCSGTSSGSGAGVEADFESDWSVGVGSASGVTVELEF
jgi:hypothetical protein